MKAKRRRRQHCADDDELKAAILRARRLWEDLFRLMMAKDRYLARGLDPSELERVMNLRGVELAREEALIKRLDADEAEAPHTWRAAPWAR